jgi:hypothetical protein
MNALENFQRGFGKENALALVALMDWKFVYHKRKSLTTDFLRRSQKLFELFFDIWKISSYQNCCNPIWTLHSSLIINY